MAINLPFLLIRLWFLSIIPEKYLSTLCLTGIIKIHNKNENTSSDVSLDFLFLGARMVHKKNTFKSYPNVLKYWDT